MTDRSSVRSAAQVRWTRSRAALLQSIRTESEYRIYIDFAASGVSGANDVPVSN